MKKKVLLTIWITILWLFLYLIYDILNYKERLYWISKVELEIWNRYKIGTKWKDRKICDSMLKYWCLEWNILSYKVLNDNIYIYYTPYKEYSTTMGSFLYWDKVYSVFWPYDNHLIFDVNKIPNLIKIDNFNYWVKEYYLSSDIAKLNNTDKDIFNELIKNWK